LRWGNGQPNNPLYLISNQQYGKSNDRISRLQELKKNLSQDIIIHVVGTKSDVVTQDPSLRAVPFERCIAYVAENLYPSQSAPNPTGAAAGSQFAGFASAAGSEALLSPSSKRSSGFWGQEVGWDTCHEISAKDGEGVEEVFRVITRKLVEQRNKRLEAEMSVDGRTPGWENGADGYFDHNPQARPGANGGSFRVGHGDKRRSWLGFPSSGFPGVDVSTPATQDGQVTPGKKGDKCC
jgi:hypothetical protein